MPSTTRFLRQYLRPGAGVRELETTYRRGEESLPATLFRPPADRRLPGWIVLHGLTKTGRRHPTLVRFVRAIAAGGNAVLVPEIPEWRELHVAPALAGETIRAAVASLHDHPDVDPERVGLFGFSFGATQALVAVAEPAVQSLLRAIVAWGGFHDVHRLFTFGLTGEHALDGVEYHVPPDPYGAWVMIGNYLTGIPGYEGYGAVAAALHELAREAGVRGFYAWDPVYDESKLRLRAGLRPEEREFFDAVAPPAAQPVDVSPARRALALELADAALRADPLLDPQPFLHRLCVTTLIAHGHDDRLVPFTESIRLARSLPPEHLESCTITHLFAHSGGTDRSLGPLRLARESGRFVRVLHRILHLL
jgi:acetyl esterase/lipase